jgi:hypothetical protein
MIRPVYILLTFGLIFFGSRIYSQTMDPSFEDFKKYKCPKELEPKFSVVGPAFITTKNISFRLNNFSGKKPVFCRMEDNISSRHNFIFQLRAGTDDQYRKLAFPKKVEKTPKFIE